MPLPTAIIDNLPPLLPKESVPPYVDVAPVLRSCFQDILGSTDSYEDQNPYAIRKSATLSRDDINDAEYNVMAKQAEYVICQNILEENVDIMERMHLKRPKLIGSPHEVHREKFHLLKADDLKGEGYEQSELSLYQKEGKQRIKGFDGDIFVPKSILQMKCTVEHYKAKKPKSSHDNKPKNTSDILEVTPATVTFHNYKPFVKYVKVVRLRNKTNRSIRFYVRSLGTSQFQVNLEYIAPIVPPGLPVYIKINFTSNNRMGDKTQLRIYVKNCNDLNLDLIAFRDPPILKGIVLDLDFELKRTASDISDMPRQSDKDKVLNRSIECGSCLLGDFKEAMLLVKNIGGPGRFFIISEEDWYRSTVTNVTEDGFLLCPPFCICPVFFSVPPGGIAALQTVFLPRVCGAHVERILIICDNCTIRGADLLGDGVAFSRDFIFIDIPLKNYEITMDGDNDAEHYLDFGELAINTSKGYNFTIKNVGPVELSFYWEAREPNICWTSANPGINNLSLNDVKVSPVNGVIETNETINLTMSVHVKKFGNFRGCIGLYVTNIPIESAVNVKPEAYIQHNSNTETNRISILISLVEVWVRCSPARLSVQPCVLDMSCGNIIDNVKIPLTVQNISNFKTEISIGYCGPVGSVKEERPIQAPKDTHLLNLSDKRSKIPVHIKKPTKPCALFPGAICADSCKNKSACRAMAKKNVFVKEISEASDSIYSQIKPAFREYSKHIDVIKEDKEDSDFICVVPKNYIGIDRTVASLSPVQAMSEKASSLQLQVNLILDGCQKTHERFVFVSTDGSAPPQQLDVKVLSQKHCLNISKALIDFGEVKSAARKVESFVIKKICVAPICWILTEYQYNFETMKFEICIDKNLSLNRGKLNKNESTEVKYSLQSKRYGPMLGVLEIKCWKKFKNICEFYYIIIRAVIHQPNISIRDSANSPTLSITERLFVGVPYTGRIILRNNGKIPTTFMWDKPTGSQAYFLSIKFSSRADEIEPNETKVLDVEITPKRIGFINQVYVPCFIGRYSDPLFLHVQCFVDNIRVSFSVPVEYLNSEPTIETLLWVCPEYEIEQPLPGELSTGIHDSTSGVPTREALKKGQTLVEDMSPEVEVRVHNLDETFRNTSEHHLHDEIDHRFILNEMQQNLKNKKFHAELYSTIKQSYWKYVFVEGIITNAPTLCTTVGEVKTLNKDELLEALSEENVATPPMTSSDVALLYPSLQTSTEGKIPKSVNVINLKVLNLQTKTPLKKTIVLKNLSPISSTFTVSIKHYGILETTDQACLVNNTQAVVFGQPYDEWTHRVPLGQGLIIYPVDRKEVDLEGNGCYNIDIIFYANTWGFYNDVLTIHVSGLHPFHIPVIVIASGYPIYVPISQNKKIPTIDFGTFSNKSNKQIVKRFMVKNICDIPVKLSWHVFMDKNDPEDFLLEKEPFPFNIVVDMYNEDSKEEIKKKKKRKGRIFGNNIDVLLTDYYGTEVFNQFQIVPTISEIMPGKTNWFSAVFNPRYLDVDDFTESKDLECCLVAFIRIRDKDKFVEPRMLRTDGSIFKPVLLFGRAQSEIKSVSVEIISCDSTVKISATDVMCSDSRSLKICQRITIKNTGDDVNINIITEDPYKIILLKSQDLFMRVKADNIDAFIHNSELLEVEFEAIIELRHLWIAWRSMHELYNTFIYKWPDWNNKNSSILNKIITVTAGTSLKQTLNFDIEIYFPDLHLCTDDYIYFGPVFIGDTTSKSIILRNNSSCKIDFKVQMKYDEDEFTVITKSGTVNPIIGKSVYSTMVHIQFCPKSCKKFSNVVQILTCLPFYSFQIYVTGFGTNDSKYRVLETIVS